MKCLEYTCIVLIICEHFVAIEDVKLAVVCYYIAPSLHS